MADHVADILNQLAEDIANANEDKGFWDHPSDPLDMIPKKLALIHSEVTEALDVHRAVYDDDAEDPVIDMTPMQEEDFTEELADLIIRGFDLAGYYDLDIGNAVVAKLEKNKDRPNKHGKRY